MLVTQKIIHVLCKVIATRATFCLIFALGAIITACDNAQQSKPPANGDSARIAQSTFQEDSSSIFSNNFSGWLDSNLHTNQGGRKIMLEEHWNDDSLPTEPFAGSDYFYTTYGSVLRWSADSAYILDIGSYGLIPVKGEDGRTVLEGGEPDSELALIDLKKRERKRLMFVGPAALIINARWLSNSEASVLGTFRNEDGATDTLLWMIDVKENLFRLYNIKNGQGELR